MRSLATAAIRASAFSLAAQGIKILINLAGIAILARLLTADDFGVFGMAAFVTGFVGLLFDFGLNQATTQRTVLTPRDVSTLFWLMVAASLMASLLAAVAGPAAARIYGDPRVGPATVALSSSLLISGFGAQHHAMLGRELRFDRLALAQTASVIVGFTVAVCAARGGAGHWTLVIQHLVGGVTSSLALWILGGWVPRTRPSVASARALLPLGLHVAGFRLVNHLVRNLDNALIGWMHGAVALGHYTRAYSLFLQPLSNINGPIGAVMVVTLSRARTNPGLFAHLYLGALRITCWLVLPLAAFTVVAADDVVLALLGPGWQETVLLFRLLSISALGQVVNHTLGWIYHSLGRGRALLRWGASSSVFILGSFIIGLPFGARGVALAYSCVISALVPAAIYQGTRGTQIRVRDVAGAAAVPMVSAGFVTLITFGLRASLPADWPAVVRLGILGLAALVCWLLSLLLCGDWRKIRLLMNSQRVAAESPSPVFAPP